MSDRFTDGLVYKVSKRLDQHPVYEVTHGVHRAGFLCTNEGELNKIQDIIMEEYDALRLKG